MFTKEEAEQIKRKIIEQIESWNIEEEEKQRAKSYIISLNEEQLEDFLKKNNIIVRQKSDQTTSTNQNCIFCMILQGKINSYKIDEDENSVAVLDIKPISKGHVLVIPKNHGETENISPYSFAMALKIAKRLKQVLNPKEITISTSNAFGHAIINVIPLLGNETGERREANAEELKELQKNLIERIGKEDQDMQQNQQSQPLQNRPETQMRPIQQQPMIQNQGQGTSQQEKEQQETEEQAGQEAEEQNQENFEIRRRIP